MTVLGLGGLVAVLALVLRRKKK
ncbi:MAG: LPXTG cell wall anchor domain-containing protein [Streptococcus minor]|nr:LPXTG cell wall anchor domain-containing protein [Streptococcus minor]